MRACVIGYTIGKGKYVSTALRMHWPRLEPIPVIRRLEHPYHSRVLGANGANQPAR